jgi:hypothetical protein
MAPSVPAPADSNVARSALRRDKIGEASEMNIINVDEALRLASSPTPSPRADTADAASLSAIVESSSAAAADSNALTDSTASAPSKRAYPAPAEIPTQEGPKGIRFDFNDGCRVMLPEAEHPWKVRLSDIDTGNILFETEMKAGRVNSTNFVRARIEIWADGKSVFSHDYAARQSRGARSIAGRHPRRPAGLVSLCCQVQGQASLQAHLPDGR